MSKQSPEQQKTIARVMHEFKQGELEGRDDKTIKNPKQAIAIALHEAGASRSESTARNKRNLAETKRKERAGQSREAKAAGRSDVRSKIALYAEARRRDIPGRSKMSKAQLERALDH